MGFVGQGLSVTAKRCRDCARALPWLGVSPACAFGYGEAGVSETGCNRNRFEFLTNRGFTPVKTDGVPSRIVRVAHHT